MMNSKTRKKLNAAGYKIGDADEFLGLTATESKLVREKTTGLTVTQSAPNAKQITSEQVRALLDGTTDAKAQRKMRGPKLPPPAGYPSWLAYAVATMDDRSLQNEHDAGLQPQWPARVTRVQMRAAAKAELKQIEGLWCEMERAWGGKIETTTLLTSEELATLAQKMINAKTQAECDEIKRQYIDGFYGFKPKTPATSQARDAARQNSRYALRRDRRG